MTPPIPTECIRHKCPFCRRTWTHKQAAVRHIARCWANPEVKSCKSCGHFCKAVKATGWDPNEPDYYGEPEGCAEGIRWEGNQMPVQCAAWQSKGSTA